MSQLSAQSIYRLCQPTVQVKKPGALSSFMSWFGVHDTIEVTQVPMIHPFEPEKKIACGKSYGLSSASYDCRIKEDIVLAPFGVKGCCSLAHTIEKFCIPDNVCGYVLDKSSYARVFVSALNTLFDPGFSGYLEDGSLAIDKETSQPSPYASAVLELVNFGEYEQVIPAGSPICQFAFHWLDEPTDRPYRGKYAGQTGAQPAIFEDYHKPEADRFDGMSLDQIITKIGTDVTSSVANDKHVEEVRLEDERLAQVKPL